MFKINNKDSKTTRRSSGAFASFEHISHFDLVFLLLPLNMWLLSGIQFWFVLFRDYSFKFCWRKTTQTSSRVLHFSESSSISAACLTLLREDLSSLLNHLALFTHEFAKTTKQKKTLNVIPLRQIKGYIIQSFLLNHD